MSREQRKMDHIFEAVNQEQTHYPFEDITFIHQALATSNVQTCSLEATFLGHSFPMPLLINAMTGGGGIQTLQINEQLAEVAQLYSIPMAVGSQMAAIKDPSQAETYKVIRQKAPSNFLIANLGAEATAEDALSAVEMIEANALQIHFNHIQELAMPEGDRNFSKRLHNLESIVHKSPVPVIAKEVGFGMTRESIAALKEIGVAAVDVSGKGGTNFSRIENARRNQPMSFFNNWGISTPIALAEATSLKEPPVLIASGGITSSFDVAKSIALGASMTAMSGKLIQLLVNDGLDYVISYLQQLKTELTYILAALNVSNLTQLQSAPFVISGKTHHWLHERGIETSAFSQR
ncbi:isopentenyl-diphosphate delta-isomerase [Alkalihalobacillus xiaoxiensis]|uniref:Isopentenyl-diphosphate delta-isomerase n=1 Tax=Shouchella xiaoxiensis TaxID=766895 RepID=A0ABS2SV75_9BACI|nr:type 2 isopentenyl-diphosphate Delta-isomerase [Shouchella xiaoxiensis]MBM7838710.1 isopentenyl-diphosphate delta-isomerase [Shouchella xiaoxiensis]